MSLYIRHLQLIYFLKTEVEDGRQRWKINGLKTRSSTAYNNDKQKFISIRVEDGRSKYIFRRKGRGLKSIIKNLNVHSYSHKNLLPGFSHRNSSIRFHRYTPFL